MRSTTPPQRRTLPPPVRAPQPVGRPVTSPIRAVHALLVAAALAFAPVQYALAAPLDTDGDGYPDATEITGAGERLAFAEWFAAIAEAQYTAPSPAWEHRDCSGLLRFAFVQALEPKTAEWFARFPYLAPPAVPPPAAPGYPMPVVSRSVFRIAPGPYAADDVHEGKMVGMATAAEMMHHSSVPLGRTPDTARRGDLIFYAHPLAEGSGYHAMVYLGDGMVVYHTGASPEEGGEVRLLSLSALGRHPDPSWHPVPANPHFLGFFRWKIID